MKELAIAVETELPVWAADVSLGSVGLGADLPIIHLPLDFRWETIDCQFMLDERFWSKVKKSAAHGCWEWQANKNNKGYGMFSVSSYVGKKLAHRLSYASANGPIPAGIVVRHRCDNPACVNPSHLVAGTQKQNMTDAAEKERIANTRLSTVAIISLLKDYVAGVPRKALCKRYGLQASSLSSYTDGKAWTHLHGKHGCPTLADLVEAKRRTPSAKIDLEAAREIKRRLAAGELGVDLAAAFGIHKATISDIKRGKIWRDA